VPVSGDLDSDVPALVHQIADLVRTLWGRPVVVTTAQTASTFLVGDFQKAATLYDRLDPTLDIATQDQDDFLRNLLNCAWTA
jgi:HK97 family phage major capsid protein